MNEKRKIIVAITGASGSIYAQKLLEKLYEIGSSCSDIAVVITENAKTVWEHENKLEFNIKHPANRYDNKDFNAPFASGSCDYDTMFICPASMGTIGRIANGVSDDLISRAADVMLKERRRIIIVPRETPYNLIHIRNMETLTLAGAIICPATPSFYNNPQTIDELAMTVIERILVLADFDIKRFKWNNND